ncbi:alcohol dehydrogenase [acceptor]-like [Lycorma delicatula]|uniref:alcohol dehydrogenase [acceptor]-like n=1 Tax=Lycorma delicatula TaxID=130591 RepID=UPI003F5108A0
MLFYGYYCWILLVYSFCASLFTVFIYLHYGFDKLSSWITDDSVENVYDYVIVGAGTAGSIVAAGLATDPDVSVIILEAGGSPSPLFDIPLSAPMLQLTPYDWQYKTVPQRYSCFGLTDKVSPWPRGKILGGSSRLNYMVYVRGHCNDYNTWSSDDNEEWTCNEAMKYFRRSERQTGRYHNNYDTHSRFGSVAVSDLKLNSPFADALLAAALELGFKPNIDLNTCNNTGFMKVQSTTLNGSRFSTDKLLYNKKNIKILTNSHVEKVLLRRGYEAWGVRYWKRRQMRIVQARRAVILSAGTVATPQILMLSGIGPQRHLDKHGIKTFVNLPVGDNLQDHVATGLDIIKLNSSSPIWHTTMTNPKYAYDYFVKSEGPFTFPGCEIVGLMHSPFIKSVNNTPPDIQIMTLPAGLSTDAGVVLRKAMGINNLLWKNYFAPLVGQSVGTMLATLLHPKSRGVVRLRSSDPFELPIIDPQYLSHPDDLHTLSKGMEILVDLIETRAMKRVNGHLNRQIMPGCEAFTFGTKAYWGCYIRHLTLTAYHPVGTCKMGMKNDKTSVVDTTLRVHNTNHLFVVDASVMPTLPSSNINSVVMMIAEKAVDIIRRMWFLQKSKCLKSDILLQRNYTPVDYIS